MKRQPTLREMLDCSDMYQAAKEHFEKHTKPGIEYMKKLQKEKAKKALMAGNDIYEDWNIKPNGEK